MRSIKDIYGHLTSKSSYTYPEPSSVLISMSSKESSVIENIERQSRIASQGQDENTGCISKPEPPIRLLFHPGAEVNTRIKDHNIGYSLDFGYERVIIKGDNDYQRWLKDYAKKDMFTDWVETTFGRLVGR
ncbi:hypothetical protein PNEG_01714 [Pneumocystis murina B123]|uniref:Uncharacterized protein n=1 Tax=Pneumocystis murina (strain B123) TaxID=1069680 RepID=M7NS61_PNEMU|nr:hypothetical protein PNEG_01714 [Pneumocystis murina B123]EMR09956.1 hypothetical protein PNEG_01714 [Pneumocystis murina B123]